MSQVDSLPLSWDAGLIVLSYIQAVQASYTAVHILQLRVSRWLYVVGALCLAVSGIWSMHFVGMAALRLPVNISFDLGWTIGSAFFAFVPCALGMLLVGEKVAYAPADDISVAAHLRVLKETAHHWMLAAGSLIALGVCAMHYTGMHAMQTEATHHHEWGTIIGSCFIALFAATAALYFAFVLPLTRSFTVPTSLIAGVAVCGMHYTGMYGITYRLNSSVAQPIAGTNQLIPYVPYIIVGSWLVSFASLALATYLYRCNLSEEKAKASEGVAFATEMSRMIGRYQMDRAMIYAKSYEGKMDESLRGQFSTMLQNLEPYKAYLPQSLFVDGEDEVDEDDEGDITEGAIQSIASDEVKSTSLRLGNASLTSNPARTPASPGRAPRSPMKVPTSPGRSHNSTFSSSMSSSGRSDGSSPKVCGAEAVKSKVISVLTINLIGYSEFIHSKGIHAATGLHEHLVETVNKVALSHRGLLDSMSGDRIVVTWNAGNAVANHMRCAASTALELKKLWKDSACPLSMGLATGTAFVGNMGSSKFRRFCMLGKVMNDAYVLERLVKQYDDVTILTTQYVAESLGSDFFHQHVGLMHIPSNPALKTVISSLENTSTAPTDEWMYQLQQCEDNNPYVAYNNKFLALARATGKVNMPTARLIQETPLSPTCEEKAVTPVQSERLKALQDHKSGTISSGNDIASTFYARCLLK